MIKIAAIVVTFNRLTLLKECLTSIKNQTRKLDEIIVVNNSCTDGTSEWLSEQKNLTTINQANLGSAGGQYTGIKYAYENGYDYIWCLDTDVLPNEDALAILLNKSLLEKKVGFVTSTIYHRDGKLAFANIPELDKPERILHAIAFDEEIPVLSASFGSLLLKREVISKVGFPCKEFFIWGDDAEYTLRIIKKGFSGLMVRSSIATHYNDKNEEQPYKILRYNDPKFLYGVRNMVYVSIQRNLITHGSKFRGIISGLGFVLRIYNEKKREWFYQNSNLIFLLSKLFLSGIFFKPKIELPVERITE